MMIPAHSYGPAGGSGSRDIRHSTLPFQMRVHILSKAKKDLHGRVLNHEGTKEDMKKVRINKLISAIITYFFYFVTG